MYPVGVSDLERRLTGGNVSRYVVRVGNTVRKPATDATSGVEAFLQHLHEAGFLAAPRTLGRDERGRHVLEFIPGSTVDIPGQLSSSQLYRVGSIIRELHTASETFVPPSSAKWQVAIEPDAPLLICHHDLAPWNLVIDGDRWVFIDWDGSGPGSRLWDLAYAAQSFVPLIDGGNPVVDAVRLRSFVDGYALDEAGRRQLPKILVHRTHAMYRLLLDGAETGQQPWASLYKEGHDRHWRTATRYIEENLGRWRDALR